jgi:hypothetical protein
MIFPFLFDLKNFRDPTPRAVPKAGVPRGTSVLGSRYVLLYTFLAKQKSRELWVREGEK